jgi:hypothetical protein
MNPSNFFLKEMSRRLSIDKEQKVLEKKKEKEKPKKQK